LKKIIRLLLRIKHSIQAAIAASARRFDNRTLILVGLLATSFAMFSFAVDTLAPGKSKSNTDKILKARLSGPAASTDILIVDIDERSIALLAPTKGNWPWPRDTLADGLQKLADLGARSVLFNVLMSDPDTRHVDADAAMDVTATMVRQAAFPLIRLNPANDAMSALKVDKLPGAKLSKKSATTPTIAAIIPAFASMQDRMGVANQRPDADGIVRRYPLTWTEDGYTLPSIISMSLRAGGLGSEDLPAQMTLNWRNKKGHYQRISFADLLQLDAAAPQARLVKNAFVVLGVSAPGIGQIKPTAVSAIEDDNEIMATALDDAVHHTYFRTVPRWILLMISIASVWGLVWLGINRVAPDKINRIFIYLQLALGSITLLAASYTYHLIDLSESMSFALAVFAAVKLIRTMSDNSARAKPGYRQSDIDPGVNKLILAGFRRSIVGNKTSRRWENAVLKIAGMRHVIRIDDLYGGQSFVVSVFADYQALIILTTENTKNAILSVFESGQKNDLHLMELTLPDGTDISSEKFKAWLAGMLAKNCAEIYAGPVQA
jgi:CHASE2 domain-containing sensor protein